MPDPTATTSPEPDPSPAPPTYHLYPRREPFEHGLLPKLISTDALSNLKSTLLPASGPTHRIKPDALAQLLHVSSDHARLVIETLASVLPDESDDPLASATSPSEIDVNVFDLLVFLYVQSYKRLLPKGHRDSAAVADVWPSTSAFDGFLSALSPLQLVRSNSRKFMPSQADEEAHQLSYLQKHLSSILSLLADSAEGEGDELLVISMDRLEHLGLLMYFGEKGSSRIPLKQVTPFFANSDPEMPAAPVPVSHVLDWLLQNIFSTLEHMTDKVSSKENGPSSSPEQDVAVADAKQSSRGPSFIEGISKSSYVKLAYDLKGTSVKVVNCHESVIYILAPVKYATIYGCSDATIVLGAVGKALRVEHCERVHVIVAANRICIANCRECVFFLGVNQQPLIIGDNHKLQVAPYNTFYSKLEDHMKEVGVDPNINWWDEHVTLGVVDPHDSLSHPAGVSDAQPEFAARLDPIQYTNFVIPNCLEGEQAGSTKNNPFPLPDAYCTSQQNKMKGLEEVKQNLREAQLEESRKRELSTALHACFKDWLYASGNIRQLYYVQSE